MISILIFNTIQIMAQQHHAQDYISHPTASKQERYKHLIQVFTSLSDAETHPLSNSSNLLAILKQQFNWWWIGYYFLSKDSKGGQLLALGQFQGPIACTKLFKGKGVCGCAWAQKRVVIVPDVDKFPGHIACSSASKSQIVLPLYVQNQVIGVLDIDSEKYSQFDEIDGKYLTELIDIVDKAGGWAWFKNKM